MEGDKSGDPFLDFIPPFCPDWISHPEITVKQDIPEEWFHLTKQPIAILGNGKSGQGTHALLQKIGWDSIIYDQTENDFRASDAGKTSLVIYSPGFVPDHPWIELAKKCGKLVLSEVDFAAKFLDARVVAITGTNGKSSLTTILAHVWSKIGRAGFAGGNLGEPLSSILANEDTSESTLFLEMSSFQARGLQVLNPTYTLWTNFSPDHLNYHGSMRDYFLSKYRLVERTNPRSVWLTQQVVETAEKFSVKIPDGVNIVSETSIELPRDHFLNTYPQKQNLSLACAWLKNQGIAEDIIVDALLDYKPEPHRLSKVCSIDEVKFWNDSKSTNLGSVISACKSFPAKIIWIGGGQSKGEDLGEYARSLKPYVSHAFLFGESSTSLHQCMTDAGILSTISRSLGEAVSQAYDAAQKAVDILFSPGFASFDHFKNYLERGNSFIQFVLDLKNTVLKGTQEGSHFHTPSRKLLV